jgi:hypothetical protein
MCSPLYGTHCYDVGMSHSVMGVGRKGGQLPLILKFNSCLRNLEVLKSTNIDRFIDQSALRFCCLEIKNKRGRLIAY